jgi:hypothetical protein
MPVSKPVDVLKFMPGTDPLCNVYVYGGTPPLAVNCRLTVWPAAPETEPGPGSASVEIAALIVIAPVAVAVACVGVAESVTRTVAMYAPAVVAVPVTTPVAAFRFRPGGKLPLCRV